MKFSIIHPTARVTPDFANPWWKAALSVAEGCDDLGQVEYIIVVHRSRYAEFKAIPAFDLRWKRSRRFRGVDLSSCRTSGAIVW